MSSQLRSTTANDPDSIEAVPPRFLVAAPSWVVSAGLSPTLASAGMVVLGEVHSEAELACALDQVGPNVVAMQAALLAGAVSQLLQLIKAHAPHAALVLADLGENLRVVLPALGEGALSYLGKGFTPTEFAAAVRGANAGKAMADRHLLLQAVQSQVCLAETVGRMSRIWSNP